MQTRKDVDLSFLLTAVNTVASNDFTSQKDFVRRVLDRLTIGPNDTQVRTVTIAHRMRDFSHHVYCV